MTLNKQSKLIKRYIDLCRVHNFRYSLFDLLVLQVASTNEWFNANEIKDLICDGNSKSSTDKPISKLIQFGFIERFEDHTVSTRQGYSRIEYQITKEGRDFLEG